MYICCCANTHIIENSFSVSIPFTLIETYWLTGRKASSYFDPVEELAEAGSSLVCLNVALSWLRFVFDKLFVAILELFTRFLLCAFVACEIACVRRTDAEQHTDECKNSENHGVTIEPLGRTF